jgi:hypothetical protein
MLGLEKQKRHTSADISNSTGVELLTDYNDVRVSGLDPLEQHT